MQVSTLNKGNGWSDFKIEDCYRPVLEHCSKNGFSLDLGLDLGCRGQTIDNILFRYFPVKKVYGFEPSPDSFKEVQARYKANPAVKVFDYAVSNTDEMGTLYMDLAKPSGNSLRPHKAKQPVDVRKIRLDTWAKEHNITNFDVVKIDIEGHELEALEGMGEYLNTVNVLLAEVRFNDRPTLYHKVANFLDGFGLQLYTIVGLYFCEERISWGDVIFVRNSK